MRIPTIVAALALCGPAAAAETAGAAPAVVSCSWEGGATELFRIAPASWSDWNAKAWRWDARECNMWPMPMWVQGDSRSCAVEVSEQKYEWVFRGYGREPGQMRRGERRLTLDRRTGEASYTWSWANEFYNIPPPNRFGESGALKGVCKAAADPSGQPKPPPPAPKF